MQGALLPVAIEWIILALAPLLAVAMCSRDFLWSRGIFGFRCGTAGPASDVTRNGLGEDFADLYDQLSRLGFRPAGVYWENCVLAPVFRQYIFLHPQSDCFAAIYRLFGNDINVLLMTLFTDGALVKTSDMPEESIDEPGYVVRRLPSQPVAELFEAHEAAVSEMAGSGRKARSCNDMDSIQQIQREVFFHPTATQELQQNGRTMLRAKLGLIGCCAVPLLLLAACLAAWPVIRTMLLLGAATWVITISTLFLSLRWLIKLMSTGQREAVNDRPDPKPYIGRIVRTLPLVGPICVAGVWQFGAASVALWTLVIVSCVSVIDMLRVFCHASRHPFASADNKAEA